MRTITVEQRIGELVGAVDWEHPIAKDMPQIWKDAAATPDRYRFNGRSIVAIGMYDGWPYWTPRPAVCFIGPLNSAEWTFFDSYGVHQDSIAASSHDIRQAGES